jgi:hypothetical protein
MIHGIVASGRFPLLSIDEVRIGSQIWRDTGMVALPATTDAATDIDGILGIDFLRRYGVGFSARDRVVRLYSPDLISSRSYSGWASIPLAPLEIEASSEPLYYFEIEIGGRPLPALFDLGAGLNMINRAGARYLHLVPVSTNDESVLAGAIDTAPVLARLESALVTTADVSWRNEVFLIADLEIYSTLLHEDRPLAIIGAGLFNQRDFVIDFARQRLLVRVSDELEESP